MRYPVLLPGTINAHLGCWIDGAPDNGCGHLELRGDGLEFDLAALHAVAREIRAALDRRLAGEGADGLDDDQFEGAMSILLFEAIGVWPIEMLDDQSFWAFVATGPLWFFVRWRENPDERIDSAYRKYLDGGSNHDCVPLRMFLRAQAVAGGTGLAAAVPAGTDFWRSHIIRVRTGSMPPLARAVTEQQRDNHMATGTLREYAKRINRRWSNQVIYALDQDECKEIAASERE